MLNSKSKSVYTCTTQLELKGLGLNSGVALKEPLLSKANWGKKVDSGAMEKGHVVWWDESRLSDGVIRVRREAD